MTDTLTKLRDCREMARQCKCMGETSSRRSFIAYALFWRRILRVERMKRSK